MFAKPYWQYPVEWADKEQLEQFQEKCERLGSAISP